MDFSYYDEEDRFYRLWQAVRICREIPYSLFTFGDSDLQYFLLLQPQQPGEPIKIRRGEIRITRPLIITPNNADPEFQHFFESADDAGMVQFLMTRSAAFSNLKISNHTGQEQIVSDQIEEVVERLNEQLDHEEEDRIAILVAPEPLAGVALLRLTSEKIFSSAHENFNELRERGFL